VGSFMFIRDRPTLVSVTRETFHRNASTGNRAGEAGEFFLTGV
jgi:hypothetical protein